MFDRPIRKPRLQHVLQMAAFIVIATPAAAQERSIHAGIQDMKGIRLPSIEADTIERFFEQGGQLVSSGLYFVDSRRIHQTAEGSLYIVVVETHDPSGGITRDSIAMSPNDLRPVWHRVHARTDSAAVRYEDSRVNGWVAPARQGSRPIATVFDTLPFPSYRFMLGSLPLAEGYRARVLAYNMWTDDQIWVHLSVNRREVVQVSGHDVDAWVVDVRLGERQDVRTFWIDARSGREIKQSQTFPDGRKVWQIRR